jgi:hypothetical protein
MLTNTTYIWTIRKLKGVLTKLRVKNRKKQNDYTNTINANKIDANNSDTNIDINDYGSKTKITSTESFKDKSQNQINFKSDPKTDSKTVSKSIQPSPTLDDHFPNSIIPSTNDLSHPGFINPPQPNFPMLNPTSIRTDPVYIRDNQVLNDKLYPPLGRTERPQFDLLMNFINNQQGVFNMYTRGPPDTFRPVGYLTPKNGSQTIDSTLILYGRAKYPNSDLGEFYVTSSNKISDIKVPLLQNNSNVRKITDIPSDVNIGGNILAGEYNFTELPKADLTYPYV